VDSEYRILQEQWTYEYRCVSMYGKALRLICSDSIPVLKEYNY